MAHAVAQTDHPARQGLWAHLKHSLIPL
ncbi:hypothetical protein [Caldalkalibacillus thermarum]